MPPKLYTSVSVVSVSLAATAAPTFCPAAVFSATLRATGAVSLNTGRLFPVLPVPEGDHALGVSPFSARTRTS